MTAERKVARCLWFQDQAEDAAEFYTTLVPGSTITNVLRMGPGQPALIVEFNLGGTPFQALNGGPAHAFSEAASISVTTQDQAETDRLWNALTAEGGAECRCGWLKDRFGVSWQVVPKALPRLIGAEDRVAAERAIGAMMTMNRIDIAALEAAFRGTP